MELTQIVEALLFASPDPVSTKAMAKMVREAAGKFEEPFEGLDEIAKTTAKEVGEAIEALNAQYKEAGRAFEISERATGWKLFSDPEFAPWVRELFPGKKAPRLSPPALETLAIIAYRQPLTKASVEAVRGVAVDGVLNTLLDRGLVKIGGRAELPGRPLLYETTELFLEHFGIKNVEELPNSAELRQVKLPEPEEAPAEEGGEKEGVAAEEAEKQLALSGVDSSEAASEEKASADDEEADGSAGESSNLESEEGTGESEAETGEIDNAEAEEEAAEPVAD